MSIKEVLYKISWANLNLYSASIPSYKAKKEKKKNVINADDPKNKSIVKNFIKGKI